MYYTIYNHLIDSEIDFSAIGLELTDNKNFSKIDTFLSQKPYSGAGVADNEFFIDENMDHTIEKLRTL